ncbi:MAG: glycosyltransferase family 39 protein [Candidatus Omnitrophica bacterium]|nr:glycosyltransferase family 39 protein [Candidatus Omnitrophota bacterium]
MWTAIALGLLVVGAALRVPRLFTSLFYDEIFSIQHFATLPLLHIPFAQDIFNNHILNSMLLHVVLWCSSAEAVLRLPVYLAGVASLWGFFVIGRHLGGPLAGVFAMWLAATSPYHLGYSTLARGYIPGLALALAGLVALLRSAQPPRVGSLALFGITQVLASWAMPTLAVVPVLLVCVLLLGSVHRLRALVGIDPRSPTGSAWLLTALGTVALIGLLNLPMVPFLIRMVAEGGGDTVGAVLGAGRWLSLLHGGAVSVIGLGLIGLGVRASLRRGSTSVAWPVRFLMTLFIAGFLLCLASPLSRINLIAFAGLVVLASMGIRAVLIRLASVVASAPAQGWIEGLSASAVVVGVSLMSWAAIVDAARGRPLQDVRGAVRLAESVLPDQGLILTSGFADREIAYYATRAVQRLEPMDNPAAVLATAKDFCYFRLYAAGEPDPVFEYFHSTAAPGRVMTGTEDPIALWCVRDGERVSLTGDERHVEQHRHQSQRDS